MSSQTYRERGGGGGGGDRDTNYGGRSGYNNRGGFRGRGGGGYNKPRRYWDNDEYYKDDRERGGRGRRRRSYSRSRSRSRSYSSRSRSRSHSPPPRRGRSRSPGKPEEYVPRSTERPVAAEMNEPYVPGKDASWNNSRMPVTHEYVPQANGQTAAIINQMNPYEHPVPTYPIRYPESERSSSLNQASSMMYGFNQHTIPVQQYQQQEQAASIGYPHQQGVGEVAAVSLTTAKSTKDENNSNDTPKKKKDRRKKKKRHHSSSSSSSSSDDSSDSRGRRKSRKDRGSSDSSSEDEKKDSSPGGLTKQQKDALLKQREGYQTKLEILEREIAKLQNKADELIRERVDRQYIEDNIKLQADLKGRCKAVVIVLEKIDDVLRVSGKSASTQQAEKAKPPPVAPQPVLHAPQPQVTPKTTPLQQPTPDPRIFEPPKQSGLTTFDYFDNGQHWCRLCNVFPETVEQMLVHFHSKEHHDQIQQLGIDEKPWHKRNSVIDSKPVAGARRAPFRGMQFFSPVEGWYCRLCNNWMGDPHCAVEHLKSELHNSNYMNFLEEHPDWEHKWVSDREKALGVHGKSSPFTSTKKSRFDDARPPPERGNVHQEDVESGKSIRVQMRNALKSEEKGGDMSQFTAPVSEAPPTKKDSGLDEWMTKPKVAVDIIDTQKFAAIVRQKHGAKEKETKDIKSNVAEVKVVPAPPSLSSQKERDREVKKDDRRRPDRVELQISSRDNKDRGDRDRHRERERDGRSSRRRSRSRTRSRSRSRERRYGRRRSRSRSRSRSRERSDRDRRDRGGDRERERERPDFKEAVKKLPMIGKMPLYKRPVINKEKVEVVENKELTTDKAPITIPAAPGFIQKDILNQPQHADHGMSMYGTDNSATAGSFAYNIAGYAHQGGSDQYDGAAAATAYESNVDPALTQDTSSTMDYQPAEAGEDASSGDAKGEKEDAPAALPDDFQQALDIIYSANPSSSAQAPGTVPQPVPPPVTDMAEAATNGIPGEASASAAVATEYDYAAVGANGYGSYMGYQPYHQSFDGYTPVGYEELDDGPPGVADDHVGAAAGVRPTAANVEAQQPENTAEEKDPPPPGDDDMDDLRMLGIDVEDTAVVKH